MKKTLRKIWAFILVEIIHAPKRFYIWLRGGEFAMRIKDADGEILWATKNIDFVEDYDYLFDKM